MRLSKEEYKQKAKERTDNLRSSVERFAQSILDDITGDAAFQKACDYAKLPHRYSWGNLALIQMQAPNSALVCSKTAFDQIAARQGHKLTEFAGKKQHVKIAKGSTAVYVLAVINVAGTRENAEGEEVAYAFKTCKGVAVWAAESILYCDTDTPFEVPTLFASVDADDATALWDSLTAFAEAKNITVGQTVLHLGHDGSSYGGHIEVRNGDVAGAVHPLIHELAHELLHPLADRGKERDRELACKMAEAEAESVASCVLRTLGYDTATSASYLRSYKCTPHDVTRSLDRIVGAAQEIITWLREGKLIEKKGQPTEEEGKGTAEMAA